MEQKANQSLNYVLVLAFIAFERAKNAVFMNVNTRTACVCPRNCFFATACLLHSSFPVVWFSKFSMVSRWKSLWSMLQVLITASVAEVNWNTSCRTHSALFSFFFVLCRNTHLLQVRKYVNQFTTRTPLPLHFSN